VQIAQRTVRNSVLRDALGACEHAVLAGRDISVALERTGAFPPLVVQVFAVGQASGRLEQMLENLADDYDTQVDIAAGRLTALLEPLMMILLAIAVGLVAFATILPILEAGDVL
jgi:type II secretory pathway component PulF